MDLYGFYTGAMFDAYQWMGAHIGETGVTFRTFAPNADGVSLLILDSELPMNKTLNGQFYELTVPEATVGMCYEYRIYHHNRFTDHCDPYGFGMELRPNHRSIVRDLKAYQFQDSAWMKRRTNCMDRPLNIYEMHLGSWQKNGADWFRYDELADHLIPYLKECGYTHVEMLPLSEHPCDESWGYQNTGFFAPTSRYGTAEQLMELIDRLHQNGIGAILDVVPVHFALDDYGLSNYDGDALYEYPHSDVGVSEWGSCNFMHSRGEVKSFLQSSVNYWLQEYHFDGIRLDAVSRLIYWQGDESRGENGNTIAFLKGMNQGLRERNKGIMLIAEDSTNYPKVTEPVDAGGLGFDYKWDLGWMHDTLEYFQSPAGERTQKYHKLTFSMMYFRNEKYLLPFSHDEVVHGKATILQKMSGDYDDKFPQARAMYLYMLVHPGKKLNFMGNEIGHFREWDEKRQQDWELLSYPLHDAFFRYIKRLNHLYLEHSALYEKDYEDEGFLWLDCGQEDRCIYAIQRNSGSEQLIAVFNFSDQQQHYVLSVPDVEKIELLLHTGWTCYGGTCREQEENFSLESGELICDLEPYSGMLFQR